MHRVSDARHSNVSSRPAAALGAGCTERIGTSTSWKLMPYFHVADAPKAIDFYVRALGTVELSRYSMPDGKIGHAELDLHGNTMCLADSGYRPPAPDAHPQVPVMLYVRVPNVDEVFDRAIAAGATVKRPMADRDYGERNGGFIDPFGFEWFLGTES